VEKAAEIAAIGLAVIDIGLIALGVGSVISGGVKLATERALVKGAEKGFIAGETRAISTVAGLGGQSGVAAQAAVAGGTAGTSAQTSSGSAPTVAAVGERGGGRAAVDTNVLIGVAEENQIAVVEVGLAGRSPVVPLRATREFLRNPATRADRSSFLRKFLGERGGGIDIANAASEAEAAALQAQVAAIRVPGGGTRILKSADAAIGASADRAGLELLSFDRRFVAALKSVGARASRLFNR
jgi:predicted nucleic acid-binding protein